MEVSVTVNGRSYRHDVPPRLLLVHYLRDYLNLTGAHVGCDTSQCGACVISVDGQSVKSCTLLAVQADGAEVLTVEGLAQDGNYHPVQEGFWEMHGLQCGFCTPGMIMSAYALLQENPGPSEQEIRHALAGNLCRCTGYHNIVKAVQYAAGNAAPAKSEEDLRIHRESRPMVAEEPDEISHPHHQAGAPHDPEDVGEWSGELAGESDDE